MNSEETNKARILIDYLRELNVMTNGYAIVSDELNASIVKVRAEIESIVLTNPTV